MLKRSFLILIPVIVLLVASVAAAADIQWISQEDLKELLDAPHVTIIDVRDGKSWELSNVKIPGAVREDPSYVDGWAHKYAKDARLVFYCS